MIKNQSQGVKGQEQMVLRTRLSSQHLNTRVITGTLYLLEDLNQWHSFVCCDRSFAIKGIF